MGNFVSLQRAGQGLVVGGGARDGSCCRDDDMEKSRPPLLLLIAFGIFAWPCTTYTTTAPGHSHALTHSRPLTRKTCLHLDTPSTLLYTYTMHHHQVLLQTHKRHWKLGYMPKCTYLRKLAYNHFHFTTYRSCGHRSKGAASTTVRKIEKGREKQEALR